VGALVAAALATADCVPVARSGRLYLSLDPIAPRSATARVRLCLTLTTREPKIGSLQALIRFDSTLAEVSEVRTPTPGGSLVHAARGGVITVAGASARGISGGTLLVITLRLTRRGAVPALSLVPTEVMGVDRRSRLSAMRVASLPARCAVGVRCQPPTSDARLAPCPTMARSSPPELRDLAPNEGGADPGEVVEMTIVGCGFDERANTVRFGEVSMRNLPASAGGTRIIITVPKTVPSTGEAPPMQIGAGTYAVTVTTDRGTSNVLRFTLR
jgi:hypothetical protein